MQSFVHEVARLWRKSLLAYKLKAFGRIEGIRFMLGIGAQYHRLRSGAFDDQAQQVEADDKD